MGKVGYIVRKRTGRYRANKTVIDGMTFDSEKESKRYTQLKELLAAGAIEWFEMQKKFCLAEKPDDFPNKLYPRLQNIFYIADFVVKWKDHDRPTIEDVKGPMTRSDNGFKLKWKMLLFKFHNEYYFNQF